jgi:pimeloyl-ACP methyl ester carboxylesterase
MLVAKHPNGKLSYTVIEGAGHQVIFDNPQRIAAYILQLVE